MIWLLWFYFVTWMSTSTNLMHIIFIIGRLCLADPPKAHPFPGEIEHGFRSKVGSHLAKRPLMSTILNTKSKPPTGSPPQEPPQAFVIFKAQPSSTGIPRKNNRLFWLASSNISKSLDSIGSHETKLPPQEEPLACRSQQQLTLKPTKTHINSNISP